MPTILIVEDEKELNKVLQAYLSKAGYQTLGAYRGDEAYTYGNENRRTWSCWT